MWLGRSLFVAIGCWCGAAFSAEPSPTPFWGPRNTLTYDVAEALTSGLVTSAGSVINLRAERAFLPRLTGFVTLGGWAHRDSPSWSFSAEVGVRLFTATEAPRGFFFEALASAAADSASQGNITSVDLTGVTTSRPLSRLESLLGLGIGLGYTWIFWRHAVLSIAAGASATEVRQRGLNGPFQNVGTYSGFYLFGILHGALGYAF